VDRLLKKINFTGVTERPKSSIRPRSARMLKLREKIELVEKVKVLCTCTKVGTELEERWKEEGRLFSVLQSMIFG